jgi:hypothetical protein
MNILFDRNTLKVVGQGRTALAYEIEIKDVDTTGLQKPVSFTGTVDKIDVEGNALYLLPQEDVEHFDEVPIRTKVTENTGEPVMVPKVEQVPILNEDSTQKEYEVTRTVEIMKTVTDEEGNTSEVGTGEYIQEPTGQWLKCFVIETSEVQDTDSAGQLLFWKGDVGLVSRMEPQAPLEITAADPDYIEGLEAATKELPKERTAKYADEPEIFTVKDVVAHMAVVLANASSKAHLIYDEFITSEDVVGGNADTGVKIVSIPAGGTAVMSAETLAVSASEFEVMRFIASEGIELSINGVAAVNGIVTLPSAATEVTVTLTNTADSRRDAESYAIAYGAVS